MPEPSGPESPAEDRHWTPCKCPAQTPDIPEGAMVEVRYLGIWRGTKTWGCTVPGLVEVPGDTRHHIIPANAAVTQVSPQRPEPDQHGGVALEVRGGEAHRGLLHEVRLLGVQVRRAHAQHLALVAHRLEVAPAQRPFPRELLALDLPGPRRRLLDERQGERRPRDLRPGGHQPWGAVVPPSGIASMPSLRWSQERIRCGSRRTTTRLWAMNSTNGLISSEYGPL